MEQRTLLILMIVMVIILKETTRHAWGTPCHGVHRGDGRASGSRRHQKTGGTTSMSMVLNVSSNGLQEKLAQKGVCQEAERKALIKFYNRIFNKEELTETLQAYKGIKNCCIWKGIICDAYGSIMSIKLIFKDSSTILNPTYSLWPIPLGVLKSLQALEMEGAAFGMPLPQAVALLPQSLRRLVIRDCRLLEPVPWAALGNLSRLTHLELSGNFWRDGLIEELAVCNLTNHHLLTHLDLSSNSFTLNAELSFLMRGPHHDVLACVSILPHLSFLDLSWNELPGIIPPFWNSSSSLTHLDLSHNALESSSGSQFYAFLSNNFTRLHHLVLSYNYLYRSHLPACLFDGAMLPHLSFLDLSRNQFFGQMPPFGGNLTSSSLLTFLDLSFNAVHGPIHPALFFGRNLQFLHLQTNNLTGIFTPDERLENVTNLPSQLLELTLADNQISGTILQLLQWPDKLPRLSSLDLSGNQISGTISQFPWGELLNLSVLDLSHNQLSGTLPASLGHLFTARLYHLDLSHNNMIGSLPSWTISTYNPTPFPLNPSPLSVNLIDLSFNKFIGFYDAFSFNGSQFQSFSLGISHNLLQGSIAPWLNLSSLYTPDLSHNLLHGINIPSRFIPFTGADVDISFNLLRGGVILDSLCSTTASFAASNNNFSSLVQDKDIKTCTLWSLDLHSNNLKSVLPWHPLFGNHTVGSPFQALNLADNMLSGEFPEWLGKKTYKAPAIWDLDLSHNFLSGAIPPYLNNWPDLQSIDLSFNLFSGGIPSSICKGSQSSLGHLRLADNKLKGSIPHELGHCESLQSLVLHNNRLTGFIPAGLSNLSSSLQMLDLARNHLEGAIPMWLQQMYSLRVLCLDYNNLAGLLPLSPWNTSQLQVLGLSHNNLSGVISAESLSLLQGFHYNPFRKVEEDTLYEENIIHAKGEDLKFTYILKATVHGPIPTQLGFLIDGLIFLNLSHNHLNGTIPQSLNTLKWLQSLDLSNNELEGEIPDLCQLTLLESVNVSANQLEGVIPRCNQWLTFDSSSFRSNKALCGQQISVPCASLNGSKNNPPGQLNLHEEQDADDDDFLLAIIVGVCMSFPVCLLLTTFWRPMS